MGQEVTDLRERTRRAVREEIQTVAMALFIEKGYEATTIEQIADRAGLSRRSFFRYFAGKDDVLAQELSATGQRIAGAIGVRPPEERPWVALRHGFDAMLDQMNDEQQGVPLVRAMLESAALQNRHAEKQADWQRNIAMALSPRLATHGGPRNPRAADLTAVSLASAALACLNAALESWVAVDGREPLAQLLDIAMGAVSSI